jgi:indole-3-pyruvate monooxygenase
VITASTSLVLTRAYDRLTLHLPKSVSALPPAPHPADAPDYLPRHEFARCLDAYALRFGILARACRCASMPPPSTS